MEELIYSFGIASNYVNAILQIAVESWLGFTDSSVAQFTRKHGPAHRIPNMQHAGPFGWSLLIHPTGINIVTAVVCGPKTRWEVRHGPPLSQFNASHCTQLNKIDMLITESKNAGGSSSEWNHGVRMHGEGTV